MARKLRVEYPAAICHVINRGDRREDIAKDDVDRQEMDEAGCEPLRRGWCLGSEAFREQTLERMEGQPGDHHAGDLRRESAMVRAERIIAQELERLGWTEVHHRR